MRIRDLLGRWGTHLFIGSVIAAQAISTALRGPHPIALYSAFVISVLWALQGYRTSENAVSSGLMAEALTWNPHLRPRRAPSDASPHYLFMVERMRQTESHVRAFADQSGLERITLALPVDQHSLHDARATRHGRLGHLWLGAHWFHPEYTQHLSPVLEHELAHLQRHDTRTRLAIETSALGGVAIASGMLPLSILAATTLAAGLSIAVHHWWTELACDAAAVRACGRTGVAAMWTADIADERTTSLAARARNFMRNGHRHPPLRLRRWFALHAPLRLSAIPHPLSVPPQPTPLPVPLADIGEGEVPAV
ncbi:hypothetical protein OG458_41920 (plasmid) [Streptomyces sp. NBC_01281]|uniref:hypothetical protein n=1 Tax=Streptomyces sp. NBC_01281 TaxID=2903811 RepID=UPI002E0F48EC|nr:hypothetical protein OG458_41920 [Streptomyces sp. NBC_01281]